MSKRRNFAVGLLCSLAYGSFLYWLVRESSDAWAITLWGVSPLAALLLGGYFLPARSRRAFLVLLVVLALVGAALLTIAKARGYPLVLLFLPLQQFGFVILAFVTLAVVRVRAKLAP